MEMTYLEKITQPKTVVWVDDKEDAKLFCDWLNKREQKWCNGTDYNVTRSWSYGKNTCYNVLTGTHSSKQWYISQGYTIIKFNKKDIEVKEEIKMNNFEKLAKALEQELDVPFGVKYLNGVAVYKITDKKILFKDEESEWVNANMSINTLLSSEIIKLPFKPVKGDKYWCIEIHNITPFETVWCGNQLDCERFARGDCYRTQVEADSIEAFDKERAYYDRLRKQYEEA